MRFGLNFGLLRKAPTDFANVCLTLGDDGIVIWSGFNVVSFGTSDKDSAFGESFYAFQYKATGETELRFGAEGLSQLADIYEVLVINADGSYSNVLNWDSVARGYITADELAVQYLLTQEDVCLGMYALPVHFINYNFNSIKDK